ncbi:transposase family protein [Clostridium botulinum]|uniref:transposase family protein n=1 Tax=Clostridium botulinum TaxID=1491 RepID=UPI0024187829|nr:transposase family protein [Clostridium botulinum]
MSNRKNCKCSYCGGYSNKVHSKYKRTFQDLPMQNKKVEIILNNKKYFCCNTECSQRTFAESFSCFQFKGKKTIRLEEQISRIATNMSSIVAQKYLRVNIANVSKSTICTFLKKDTLMKINKNDIKKFVLMILL